MHGAHRHAPLPSSVLAGAAPGLQAVMALLSPEEVHRVLHDVALAALLLLHCGHSHGGPRRLRTGQQSGITQLPSSWCTAHGTRVHPRYGRVPVLLPLTLQCIPGMGEYLCSFHSRFSASQVWASTCAPSTHCIPGMGEYLCSFHSRFSGSAHSTEQYLFRAYLWTADIRIRI